MEAGAAAWVPCEYQLGNWTTEPAAIWAAVFPVEYASTEISAASCSLQSSALPRVDESAAATQHDDPTIKKAAQDESFEVVDSQHNDNSEPTTKIQSPIHVFERRAHEFNIDIDMVQKKMHRYPTIIRDLDRKYTVPTMVAIGPYHHRRDALRPAEKLKHVAAYHCIRESGGRSVQEIYDAVVAVADYARSLYDKDVVAGISDDDFLPMMFYDACFLVQYMVSCTTHEMDPWLGAFLNANDEEIFHDILLLENQIPWPVVEAVMRFRPVSMPAFASCLKGCLQDRKKEQLPAEWDTDYEPPHLLGLVRHYVVGRSSSSDRKPLKRTKTISFSVSAMELAEMGITLTSNNTTELVHMAIKKKGPFFAELSLTPVSLNHARASWLVNMAALELCTTLSFEEVEDEESAVCSYLLLLAMFVDEEEDVNEFRRRHVLQGGAGLANSEALRFFSSLHSLRLGSGYIRIMEEIANYKLNDRRVRTKLHAFVYKNRKTIVTIFSAVGALVGILGTLKSYLKTH